MRLIHGRLLLARASRRPKTLDHFLVLSTFSVQKMANLREVGVLSPLSRRYFSILQLIRCILIE